MEDGLREPLFDESALLEDGVLILVLMEDGLREETKIYYSRKCYES